MLIGIFVYILFGLIFIITDLFWLQTKENKNVEKKLKSSNVCACQPGYILYISTIHIQYVNHFIFKQKQKRKQNVISQFLKKFKNKSYVFVGSALFFLHIFCNTIHIASNSIESELRSYIYYIYKNTRYMYHKNVLSGDFIKTLFVLQNIKRSRRVFNAEPRAIQDRDLITKSIFPIFSEWKMVVRKFIYHSMCVWL